MLIEDLRSLLIKNKFFKIDEVTKDDATVANIEAMIKKYL